MYNDLQTALERDNEKRLVYEYPENDLEETKVIAPIPKEPKKPVVDKPLDKEETTETDDSILKEKDEKNKYYQYIGRYIISLSNSISSSISTNK